MTLHRTTRRGDAADLAARLAPLGAGTTLLAVGGDGTMSEVANGLLRARDGRPLPRLALLPSGSGNDLARQLGIPRDPRALAGLLDQGATRPVDAGRLAWPGGERWFLNVASFGFTAAANLLVDRLGKRIGGASYVAGALAAFARHRDHPVRLGVDGEVAAPLRLGCGVAANGAWFGSGMHVAPGAAVDDGRLDFVAVGGAGRLRLAAMLAGVFTGRHLRARGVTRRAVQALRVEWDGALPFEADGEPLAVASPVEIGVEPAALAVVAPAGGKR